MDCNHCQTQFEFNGDRNYNFLSPELREYGKVKSTDVISDHHYDLISCAIIDEFQDGLILDVGCGLRNYYYHNVVNFEIVDYPTTDVLGIGERLPFKSNSFDVVFSFNVLEHVRQPFECAAEILRVLKPGGKLYVVAPFLQPFHGYPDHYYNMTSNGLKNLFGDRIELLEGGVPQWGSPIFCLNWFLLSYLGGLPPNVAEKFKQMRVADFLELPQTYLERDFVTKLAPAANEELACTNYLIARKLPDC